MTHKETVHLLETMLAALPQDESGLLRLSAEIRDWDAFLTCAERHRVAGVLLHPMVQLNVPMPGGAQKRVRHYAISEKFEYQRITAALDELLDAFHAEGIQAVALKGPLLSERLNAEPHVRLSNDLDFLLRPEALDHAKKALLCLGYREVPAPTIIEGYAYHLNFARPDRPMVELHYALGRGWEKPYPSGSFMDRAQPHVNTRGRNTWTLSPEDELAFLCFHSSKHVFSQLILLYDMKLFLLRHPQLHVHTLLERSRCLRSRYTLAYSLYALHRRLNVDTPVREARQGTLRARLIDGLAAAFEAPDTPRKARSLSSMLALSLLSDDLETVLNVSKYSMNHVRGRVKKGPATKKTLTNSLRRRKDESGTLNP